MAKENNIPQEGQTFEMTLDNFPGFRSTMKVVETELKEEGCNDTIRLQVLTESQDSEIHEGKFSSYKEFEDRFITVEDIWFTDNPKRKIVIIENPVDREA